MIDKIWKLELGQTPLIAAAIHDGHALRRELNDLIALNEAERLREEDPYTAPWAAVAETRIIGLRSRFEVDLNRPRDSAVYLTPEDAWGLQVWKKAPDDGVVARSLAEYDAFYAELRRLFQEISEQFGRFILLDLHSYNHRREGADCPAAPVDSNPEVNVGTGSMDRQLWGPVIETFIKDLRGFRYLGRQLDVRENVKFKGGFLQQWTQANFPDIACVLSIEFKKFFMDEWTGELYAAEHAAIQDALHSTVLGLIAALKSPQ